MNIKYLNTISGKIARFKIASWVSGCASCHVADGRGSPPSQDHEGVGFVMRLAQRDGVQADPIYGSQLQTGSIDGVPNVGSFQVSYQYRSIVLDDGSNVELRRPFYQITNLAYGSLAPDTGIATLVIGLGLLEKKSSELGGKPRQFLFASKPTMLRQLT